LDKAPDAFRTISEVAQDLDIPQHVLRFWETRFSQIKPMKRSGGRRYYRPDDVDLLKGIRRLLYGEGYTIRGVQRILKEHGIKSVQSLADGSAAVSFGAIEEAIGQSLMEDDFTSEPGAAAPEPEEEEEEYEGSDEEGIDFRFVETEEDILATFRAGPATRGAGGGGNGIDRERLQGVLKELIDCRQLLDRALKEG
jgi:DNA-binding transcriptional MerR regulator